MVTVYSKPNCSQCNFTKRFLNDKNVTFQVKDITESDEALNEVKALGFQSLPVVVADGQEPFNGFRPDKLQQLA
ncbi:glutaredoxin-like protein NrdH [Aerococcus kribbianus]|uniref:Glutaredoxin-like protein NrdH n=1 Tax=Aerococcus kribbianus TaxID=2999064 RepID=A0A9X3FMD3_9LACT|nr:MULTISPECIES: glutaredoxin-like protein NrdH [unclassified Aerococcus]MCZ0716904.1 glutaredoxin-like protein NrdH [Aerococcus sp. YH-aer221]MCZ0725192.1 glutaredoxin-like protein NrdH [Aerococcus sp. YH-aer222]